MQDPIFTPKLKGPVATCVTRALARIIRDEGEFSVGIKFNDFLLYFLSILPIRSHLP